MTVSNEIAPAPPQPRFRLRDMLFPETLLERTNWRDNPLVTYTQRRATRIGRVLITRSTEAVLLAGWFFFLSAPYLIGMRLHRYVFSIFENAGFSWAFYFPIIVFTLVFMLLRYHLRINDQSNHIKTLSHEKLGELLLTRLGNDDYFLHHFLLFCYRYRVLVVWGIIWGVILGYDILYGFLWVRLETIFRVLASLNIVLLTWVFGIIQYTTEWKWYAGGRGQRWHGLLGFGFSIMSALFIVLIEMPVFYGNSPAWFLVTMTFPFLLMLHAYAEARKMSGVATEWLTARYQRESVINLDGWLRTMDPFCFWRWISPRSRKSKPSPIPWRLLIRSTPYLVLFFAVNALAIHATLRIQFFMLPWVRSFVLMAIGFWCGIYIARSESGLTRNSYLRSLWPIGLICIYLSMKSAVGQSFIPAYAGPPRPSPPEYYFYFKMAGVFGYSYLLNMMVVLLGMMAGILLVKAQQKHVLIKALVLFIPIVIKLGADSCLYLILFKGMDAPGFALRAFDYGFLYTIEFWIVYAVFYLVMKLITIPPATVPASQQAL